MKKLIIKAWENSEKIEVKTAEEALNLIEYLENKKELYPLLYVASIS
jgi:hypothetical protein